MRHALHLLLLAGLSFIGTGWAEEQPSKIEWTPAEVRAWFSGFAKEAPDGERGIHYNGSDATHHWFTVPPYAENSMRTIKVRKSELKLTQEQEFIGDENGPSGAWSYVDPGRDFASMPEIGPASPETRTVEERLAALEAYREPTPPEKSTTDISASLIERAEREFAFRLPTAAKVEKELIFPKPGEARYGVIYTLPGRRTRWVQWICFHHREGVWHQSWDPDSHMIVPNPPANPVVPESEAATAR